MRSMNLHESSATRFSCQKTLNRQHEHPSQLALSQMKRFQVQNVLGLTRPTHACTGRFRPRPKSKLLNVGDPPFYVSKRGDRLGATMPQEERVF